MVHKGRLCDRNDKGIMLKYFVMLYHLEMLRFMKVWPCKNTK